MPENTPTIVLVGHCSYDSGGLKAAAERARPGVSVVRVNNEDALKPYLTPDHLLMVNRVLDGRFGVELGPALIKRLAGEEKAPAMLLISDLEDAQTTAEDNGAKPGFGKRDMGGEKAVERIREAMPA